MKKYAAWILSAVFFCAATCGGCGGGSDDDFAGSESGETQTITDNTGGREGTEGTIGAAVDLSTLRDANISSIKAYKWRA